MKSLFITFDGIDGSGKSTQIKKLAEYIFSKDKHNHVVLTREPYKDTDIRKLIKEEKDPSSKKEKLVELFLKDRKNHCDELIIPCLEKNMIVISDRFKLSTIAYQAAQGSDINDLILLHKEMPKADISFIVDVSPEVAAERMTKDKGRKLHRFESDIDFSKKIRKNFIYAKSLLNENIFIIDGERDAEDIFDDIKNIVDRKLQQYI